MKKVSILYILFTLFSLNAFAQPDEEYVKDDYLRNHDFIYKSNIKGVEFYLTSLPLSMPIIDLNNSSTLQLEFDDMAGDVSDYVYEIQHCDADWSPSNLTTMDYLEGFDENEITEYEYSFNTLTNYTHYSLMIPNANIKWTKSGNYLLHVYLDDDEKELAITRRFMVVEPVVKVRGQVGRALLEGKMQTHQEVDFAIDHKGFLISNAQQEISATVIQNGRWDNAMTNLKPLFVKTEQLLFDYQGKIVFAAGKEFRNVDLQSFHYRTDRVKKLIDDPVEGYHVLLYQDKEREGLTYLSEQDINGKFVIGNDERGGDAQLQSDYSRVFFSLEKSYPYNTGNLYLVGALSDWQLRDECKMDYNEKAGRYETDLLLKQGFYDYSYALVEDGKTTILNLSEIEGDWFETNNQYHILIYFRPFGSRYDRLIAAQVINSN